MSQFKDNQYIIKEKIKRAFDASTSKINNSLEVFNFRFINIKESVLSVNILSG